MEKKIKATNEATHKTQSLKSILRNKIKQSGEFKFTDNSWYFSKRHKDALPKGCYTIPFHQVPEQYKNWVKYYVLLSESSISHLSKKCYCIAKFLKFIDDNHAGLPLNKIQINHVNAFEYKLNLSDASFNTKQTSYAAIQDFFNKLSNFNEMSKVLPIKNINPFRQTHYKNNSKILDKDVIRKWDRVFKDETINIPLEFRTLYWLIRSFPNRITEILSMKRNCLKSFYSEYVISIPTYKQSGGYDREETKLIPVIYSGHGKYVIDLIKKLQLQTKQLISNSDSSKAKKEYLFSVRYWTFFNDNENVGIRYDSRYINQIMNWTGTKVNKLLKQLSLILDIRNDDGDLITPTTHQFRHNAVTDRLYTVGYTTEQVRRLTGHKNESMTKYYTHQLVQQHKEIHLNISGLRNSDDSPVEFQGKILNLDNRTVQQLAKDPKRYLTWEANGKKGVGICSDISGCNPKGTAIHFECYACDWFIPKLEYLEDYKKEYLYWQEIINRTSNDPHRAAHFENAIRNFSYLERIIKVCETGIKKFKENMLNSKLEGNNSYEWK